MQITDVNTRSKFEGYIWMSDSNRPIVFKDEPIEEKYLTSNNPFIIEGMLFDKANNNSYSLKNIDGQLFIRCYHIDKEEFNDEELRRHYIPKRLGNVSRIQFIQRWDIIPDPFCEGMFTKVPSECVFIGFEH